MKEINQLAKQAGFVIWGEGPRKGKVDWACEYDKELKEFAKLVIQNHDKAQRAALYDIEQPIFRAWSITDDLKLMIEKGADKEALLALVKVYEYKFEDLWNTYEAALCPTTK